MLTVEGALERIVARVRPMPTETVALPEAYGRVLAEDLRSPVWVPPWDNSAMDGYAVRAADTRGASVERPVALRVLELVGAGAVATATVEAGTAIAVMTGAPLPPGADAVVMQEDTEREGDRVEVRLEAFPGKHVRSRGEDVSEGQLVLTAGTTLGPAAVGVLGSLGIARVAVRRRPVVAIVVTGDEVVDVGQELQRGQIWSSNNHSLAGLILAAGGVPLDLGIVPDRLDDVVERLETAIEDADVVLTTGGVSVGVYDVVKDAYARLGAAIDFWRVRMKPGKPLAMGWAGDVPLFGLPGNPVSCMVNFQQFVRPYLRLALGDPRPYLPVVDAIVDQELGDPPGRAQLVRVRLERRADGLHATATGSQSSGVLTSMARADGLLLIGAEAGPVRPGDRVRVQLLDGSVPGGPTPDYGW
jgi:molybdopterin molybdotransferase